MNQNYYFLKEVQQQIRFFAKQRELSGENFNIFSIMSMESDEVFTHSAIIAELLNPKGSHSLGTKPLELFYTIVVKVDEIPKDVDQHICIKEEYIGLITEDKTGGRLDIVVKNSSGSGLVIENKIYAGEQPDQLMRYKNKYEKATLLFLTLDGEESKQVKAEDNIEYTTISYKEHIINWIEECSKLAFDKPILRETLKQYIHLLKKLTNQTTDNEMSKEIVTIIDNNFVEAAEIYKNFEKSLLKKHHEFLESIKVEIKRLQSNSVENNDNIAIEFPKLEEKDFVEITLSNGFRVKFRIKLMNIIIIVGNKIGNKIENEPKLEAALNDLIPPLRKVDWASKEWFYWQFKWNGIGNPTQIVEAKHNHNEIEIAEYINQIIHRLEKIK